MQSGVDGQAHPFALFRSGQSKHLAAALLAWPLLCQEIQRLPALAIIGIAEMLGLCFLREEAAPVGWWGPVGESPTGLGAIASRLVAEEIEVAGRHGGMQ